MAEIDHKRLTNYTRMMVKDGVPHLDRMLSQGRVFSIEDVQLRSKERVEL